MCGSIPTDMAAVEVSVWKHRLSEQVLQEYPSRPLPHGPPIIKGINNQRRKGGKEGSAHDPSGKYWR